MLKTVQQIGQQSEPVSPEPVMHKLPTQIHQDKPELDAYFTNGTTKQDLADSFHSSFAKHFLIQKKHVNSCDIDETAYYKSQVEEMKADLEGMQQAEEEAQNVDASEQD